jgi:hypothetical protein
VIKYRRLQSKRSPKWVGKVPLIALFFARVVRKGFE